MFWIHTENLKQDIGISRGRGHALNFPLRDGITNENYKSVFEPVCVDIK